MSDATADPEADAVAHMAKQIRDEEDERVRAALDKIATQPSESMATMMTRMGEQPIRVGSILMSEASYRDIVHLGIVNGVADEMRAKMAGDANPHSMGAMVADTPCPDCEPGENLTDEQRETLFKMGRQLGKTEMVMELMREHPEEVLMLGQRGGMVRSTAVAETFQANYGPTQDAEKFSVKTFRAAAEALHNASVPLEEAKQRMMDAMDKLTPEQIPLVQRELQKMLVKNGPARPVNRAQRRQVAKARRRA